jgi:quercetin dioxygenase-like cupin family protein
MHEAKIHDTETGRQPADDGWFILNLAEIGWTSVPGGGIWCSFESPDHPSPLLGIGVHILASGEAPGFYHAESEQEGFLVLSGECIAIVEGEERRMGPWDYLHCPPGTKHITIGAGDEPCAILMVGTRSPDRRIEYSPEPAAARYGHSVETPTTSSREAYVNRPPFRPERSPWPLSAPEAR